LVYLLTFGIFYGHLVYFTYGHLVYFVVILACFASFGTSCREKSGIPAPDLGTKRKIVYKSETKVGCACKGARINGQDQPSAASRQDN
jgi:hypothetical protein